MNNFRVIYNILSYLEHNMDYISANHKPIEAEQLGISDERRLAILEELVRNGYIKGVEFKKYHNSPLALIDKSEPKITLKGLEYLYTDPLMIDVNKKNQGIES